MPTNRWPCPSRVGELYVLACKRSLGAKVWLRASGGASGVRGGSSPRTQTDSRALKEFFKEITFVVKRDEHSSALAPALNFSGQ